MPFILECDACAQQFRVREAFVGRRFKCKKCGKVNEIEEVPIEVPEAVPQRRSDSELPVAPVLPPVAKGVSRKVRSPVADEDKKEIDYEMLGGRVGVLGAVDEEEEEERRKVMRQVGGGFALLLVVLIGVGIYINRRNNSPDQLFPKEYEQYIFEQGGMAVDAPVGWEVEALGGSNGVPATLKFKKGGIAFVMRENPRGSIMGGTADALNAFGGNLDPNDETSESVHVAHVSMGTMIENEYVGYEETAPKKIPNTGFGSARICQYQGGTPLGGTEYGLRATIKTPFSAYRILITMPRTLRDDFQPIAEKIIASARPYDPEAELDDFDDELEMEDAPEEEQFEIDEFTGEKIPIPKKGETDE